MKMRVFFVALSFFCLLSCSKNEVVNTIPINTPSYASSMNAFSYSVQGERFTSSIAVPLTFASDSLAYSLSVTGYSHGSGWVVLRGGRMFFRSVNITSNMSVAQTFSMMSVPETAFVNLTQFSGSLSVAVAGIPH
jgi:hypothetical protein